MELQENLEAFTRNGISVCAVSYDPVDVLHDFSERHGIQYPLLSDEHSEAIEAFGILNTDLPSGHKRFGIPHPGTFIVDGEGVIVEKFFHEELHTRDTPIAMLQQLAPEVESVALQEVVEGEALAARFWVPQSVLGYLQVTHLTVDIAVQEGFHVYGRPVPQVYTPLTLTVDARGMEVGPIAYPPPETLTLPALGEALPVYAGRLRLRVPITMTGEAPAQLNLALAYQACDDRVCLLPDELQAEMVIGYKEHVG